MVIAVPDDDIRAAVVAALPEVAACVWDWRTVPPPAVAGDIDFLVSEFNPTPPAETVLRQLTALRVVQLPSSGFEGWPGVLPPDVVLCNGVGVHGQSTAEAAVAGILAVLRQLPAALRQQSNERWIPLATERLAGRRVLILGAGDVAQRISTIVTAMGCRATLVGRTARDGVSGIDALQGLLPRADVLVVALPLTAQTTGLVNATVLAQLPDRAIVANVARGAIVATGDLAAEVVSGRLRCYLDVTDPEPLPPGHPLWSADGAVITPHTGGGDVDWRLRYQELVVAQIRRHRSGAGLRNVVAGGPPADSSTKGTS